MIKPLTMSELIEAKNKNIFVKFTDEFIDACGIEFANNNKMACYYLINFKNKQLEIKSVGYVAGSVFRVHVVFEFDEIRYVTPAIKENGYRNSIPVFVLYKPETKIYISAPRNNDGRMKCYWCGEVTEKKSGFSFNSWYDICPKCNK